MHDRRILTPLAQQANTAASNKRIGMASAAARKLDMLRAVEIADGGFAISNAGRARKS